MLKASLIIAVYNQAQNLKLILEAATKQTANDFEIVVADDGSSDETVMIVEKFQSDHPALPVSIVTQEDRGFRKTMILNKAIRTSKGEYLIFIDGDMLLEKRFIELHLRYRNPAHVLCGHRGVKLSEAYTGKILAGQQLFRTNPINLMLRAIRGDVENPMRGLIIHNPLMRALAVPHRDNLSGCNFSLYRDAIEKVNGFNEDILEHGFNDYELGHRLKLAGYQLINVSKLCNTYHLYHTTRKTRREEIRKKIEQVDQSRRAVCTRGLSKLTDNHD